MADLAELLLKRVARLPLQRLGPGTEAGLWLASLPWPRALEPQQYISPLARMAQLWFTPPAKRVALKAGMSVGVAL